jgi:hypothetical protein
MDKSIYIQQDNAPSHISPNDKLFCEAAKQDGFDIRLVCQQANSLDFNILDLGFLVVLSVFFAPARYRVVKIVCSCFEVVL